MPDQEYARFSLVYTDTSGAEPNIDAFEPGELVLNREDKKLFGINKDEELYYFISNEEFEDHVNATNPHGITAADINLGNVDNTSDVNKPISNDTQTALDAKADLNNLNAHINNTNNPHNLEPSQIGLGNVDNTSDLDKPISNDTQTALNAKATANDLNTHILDNSNVHGAGPGERLLNTEDFYDSNFAQPEKIVSTVQKDDTIALPIINGDNLFFSTSSQVKNKLVAAVNHGPVIFDTPNHSSIKQFIPDYLEVVDGSLTLKITPEPLIITFPGRKESFNDVELNGYNITTLSSTVTQKIKATDELISLEKNVETVDFSSLVDYYTGNEQPVEFLNTILNQNLPTGQHYIFIRKNLDQYFDFAIETTMYQPVWDTKPPVNVGTISGEYIDETYQPVYWFDISTPENIICYRLNEDLEWESVSAVHIGRIETFEDPTYGKVFDKDTLEQFNYNGFSSIEYSFDAASGADFNGFGNFVFPNLLGVSEAAYDFEVFLFVNYDSTEEEIIASDNGNNGWIKFSSNDMSTNATGYLSQLKSLGHFMFLGETAEIAVALGNEELRPKIEKIKVVAKRLV